MNCFIFEYQEKPVTKASGIKLGYFKKEFFTLAAFDVKAIKAESRRMKRGTPEKNVQLHAALLYIHFSHCKKK